MKYLKYIGIGLGVLVLAALLVWLGRCTVSPQRSTAVTTPTATHVATRAPATSTPTPTLGVQPPTVTPESTTLPVTTITATLQEVTVLQARDLGPWAPGADDQGESFEITARDGDSEGVIAGLWWPHGRTDWGTAEVTTFLEPGLSVTVMNGAGRGWDYPLGYPLDQVKAEMERHMEMRAEDTTHHGFVDIDTLIQMGLVELRFDRRVVTISATPTPIPVAQVATTVCKATRAGDTDTMDEITAPANTIYAIEAWGDQLGDAFVVVPANQTIDRTWQGGALWSYNCTNLEQVLADLAGRGKQVYVVVNNALVKQ